MAGPWQQSSYCTGGGCVTASCTTSTVQVRDSDHRTITLGHATWTVFLAAVKAGELE